jgi:NADPH:quinone reductase-like Zn-dependent oxidoreductase
MDVMGTVLQVGLVIQHVQVGDPVLPGDNAPTRWYRSHIPSCSHPLGTIGNVGPQSLILVDGALGGVVMATIKLAKVSVY